MKVLLVEDNFELATEVVSFLEENDFTIDFAQTNEQAKFLLEEDLFDVVVLGLTGVNSNESKVFDFLKSEIGGQSSILILSGSSDYETKEECFNLGVDDYLSRPFDLRELALRCRALSRRKGYMKGINKTLGKFIVNPRGRAVSYGGRCLQLTPKGYHILSLLIERFPAVLTKAEIIHALWEGDTPDSDSLRSHIYGVRKQLEPFSDVSVFTISGLGYKLELAI